MADKKNNFETNLNDVNNNDDNENIDKTIRTLVEKISATYKRTYSQIDEKVQEFNIDLGPPTKRRFLEDNKQNQDDFN